MKVLNFSFPDSWIPKDKKKWHSIRIEYKRGNPFFAVQIDGKQGQICYLTEANVEK